MNEQEIPILAIHAALGGAIGLAAGGLLISLSFYDGALHSGFIPSWMPPLDLSADSPNKAMPILQEIQAYWDITMSTIPLIDKMTFTLPDIEREILKHPFRTLLASAVVGAAANLVVAFHRLSEIRSLR